MTLPVSVLCVIRADMWGPRHCRYVQWESLGSSPGAPRVLRTTPACARDPTCDESTCAHPRNWHASCFPGARLTVMDHLPPGALVQRSACSIMVHQPRVPLSSLTLRLGHALLILFSIRHKDGLVQAGS